MRVATHRSAALDRRAARRPDDTGARRPAAPPVAHRRGACTCGGGCPGCRAGQVGRPLPDQLRAAFAPRLAVDLDRVRVHAEDPRPAALGAAAFALGRDVVFGPGHYRPDTPAGRHLLAHELAHVAQQGAADPPGPVEIGRAGDAFEREAERAADRIDDPAAPTPTVPLSPRRTPALQRRLLVDGDGDDVDGLLAMLSGPSGLLLSRNPLSAEIDITGAVPTPPTSPALAALLLRVIDDPDQDAELHVGLGQPRVLGGAFPVPHDLTGGIVQRIDLDDIGMLEAGNPGFGAAALAHEIEENYQAHGMAVVPGLDRYDAAHRRAIESESDVAEETVGPGRRVARVEVEDDSVTPNRLTEAVDYQSYYLVIAATIDPQTEQASVTSAMTAPRVIVAAAVIDRFAIGSPFPPAGQGADIAALAGQINANPLSTIAVTGHADATGASDENAALSTRRAEQTREALIRAGVDPGRGKERFAIRGAGEDDPATADDSAAGRARNRRVVVLVSRPGP